MRTLYNTILCLGFLFAISKLEAQGIRRFDGPFSLGELSGEAHFNYRIVSGDTIFQGPFQFQQSRSNQVLGESNVFFSILGSFENGIPNGYWKFQFGEFKSGEKSELVGFQYRLTASGTQLEASGELSLGKTNGKWVFTEQEIKDSEAHKILFKSSIIFEDGIPQQSFRIEDDNAALLGRFLRNGYAHDNWSSYANESEQSENFFFADGILQKIEVEYEETSQRIVFPIFDAGSSKNFLLNDDYFKILETLSESTSEIPNKTRALLLKNESYYARINTILNLLGTAFLEPNMQVRVPYFPMDSLEYGRMESLSKKINTTFFSYEELMGDSQLNLIKRSDSEVAYLINVLEVLGSSFLNPLKSIADYQTAGVLEHVDRASLFKKLFPKGLPNTELKVTEGQVGTYSGPDAKQFNFEGGFLDAISQMTEYATISYETIAETLDKKISKVAKQEELIELENTMVKLSDNLKSTISSNTKNLDKVAANTLNALMNNAEKQISTYSGLKNTQERLRVGRKTVQCLEQFSAIAETIFMLPERDKEIRESYQDDVWNPFMATIMKEEVKKRITSAYRSVLIPYAFSTLEKQLTCENTENIRNLLNNAFNKVLELRDKETSKLERKLRREKNPETVIELLELQSLENN